MSDGNERPRRPTGARAPGETAPPARGETRRTERLEPTGDAWSATDPVNPGWRRERSTAGAARRPAGTALPSSPQELQLWLQAGGWRYALIIAGLLVVLLIAVLAFARGDAREAPLGAVEPTLQASGVGGDTIEPLLQPSAEAALGTAPPVAPAAPTFFIVTGTGGQGLFLRPQASREGPPVTTLPDGTRVEQVGEDVPGADFVWRRVRTADGAEGYVAADFLTPAP